LRTETDELPDGWEQASVGAVCVADKHAIADGPFGTQMKLADFGRTGIPVVEMLHLSGDTFRPEFRRFITPSKYEEVKRSTVVAGDIVVSKTGTLGTVAVVPASVQKAVMTSRLAKVSLQAEAVLTQFAFRYFQFLRDAGYWQGVGKGSTMKVLRIGEIGAAPLPLPPLAEQRRIVAKVEELLAQVNQVRERLACVPAILKRFRQSVLSAACQGNLDDRSGDGMANWGRLRIGDFLSTSRPGMRTGPFGTALKKGEHVNTGIPVLGIENIGRGVFVEGSKIHITPAKAKELSAYDALPGDVIISRSGTVGEVCVVPEGLGTARISTNIIRVSLDANKVLPTFFCYLFNGSPDILSQIAHLCAGSTREFLNQTILKSLDFVIPLVAEQREIVRRVEELFKLADGIEKQVEAATKRVEKLTQAILAKAFRGELVPTEAALARRERRSYEPASVLLERIRQQRAASTGRKPARLRRE
jgi:type I restriction enzyme S subunit